MLDTQLLARIEETLARAFGHPRRLSYGTPRRCGTARADYVLLLDDMGEARHFAREMQERGVAAGVRADVGRFALRLSQNDLLAAFAEPERHSHDGMSAASLIEARASVAAPQLAEAV